MAKQDWTLTQDTFDKLLAWLDPNRELAGEKYETIRLGLIKMFTCRGCNEAEDLADETINRVARKIDGIADYEGEPAAYVFGVAKLVLKESLRVRPAIRVPVIMVDTDEAERKYTCLEKCMKQLRPADCDLILHYYREEKRAKIDHRRQLAERLGIAQNALRIRAYKVRAKLSQCVLACFQQPALG